jgi:hypothetical protein
VPATHGISARPGTIYVAQAETLFGVSSRDVGRPFSDVALSYRPVELPRYIEQAHLERRTVRVADITYLRGTPKRCTLRFKSAPSLTPMPVCSS